MAVKYKVLSPRERLVTLESFLRDREAEHYRLSMVNSATDPMRDSRLPVVEEELVALHKEYEALQRELAKAE